MDVDWIVRNLDEIGRRTLEHVALTGVAIVVGFAISFALALAIRRRRWLAGPILAVGGILYAIPSLALFAFLVPFTGIQNPLTAEIALVSYTILILVRNILAGLDGVPSEVLEAADGMGYTNAQRLWRVELPVAMPVIVAGLRIATVTGLGGLGYLIVDVGYRRFFLTATVTGAVGAVLLALLADRGFVWLQSALTPWARRRARA
jgi:osmoprotectant transport system permease protein